MKILHVDETFHPAFGYQCNPLAKFQCKHGDEVVVLAPDADHIHTVYHDFGDYGEHIPEQDKAYEEATGVSIVRVQARGYISGRVIFEYGRLFKAIEEIDPDVMLVHCLESLTAVRVLFKFSKKYPMVFDTHMLAMASRNKLAGLYEKAFRAVVASKVAKESYRVIMTQKDDYITSHLGVPADQTRFISFGTDTDAFCPDEGAKARFLSERGLPDDTFVVASTGKMSEGKRGKLFAEAVGGAFDVGRRVVVVVVANFDGDYEREVKAMLDASANEVFYYPVQSYLDLPYFYQIADVSVYPSQCSMSFYDSESCGTPVISESNNVNEDRNSHGNGLCFKAGDAQDMRAKIVQMATMHPVEYRAMRDASREYVLSGFSYDLIAREYTEELIAARDAFAARGHGRNAKGTSNG